MCMSTSSRQEKSENVVPSSSNIKNGVNDKRYTIELKWGAIIYLSLIHSMCLYWTYLLLTRQLPWTVFVFHYIFGGVTGMGVTAGAHRLWSHRSYTANLPLRIFLMLLQSAAMQNNLFAWVRDHRVHHRFTETDADPHNSNRGFFFAHCGWLMCRKHPEVSAKGKNVDMSDILADPVVKFQIRYFTYLVLGLGVVLPVALHYYIFGGPLWIALISRLGCNTITLNMTWLVNSAAHLWGMRPYDKTIGPAENTFVAMMVMGEGWHNYHHAFPWDYKTSELGDYSLNLTTLFLDIMAAIGWATNMKSAAKEMITNRIIRTGDIAHLTSSH